MRFLSALFLALLALPAFASERIALVIGNSDYQNLTDLPTSIADAAAIGSSLKKLGFEVTTGINLDRAPMLGLIEDFGARAADAKLVLFYFGGRSLQSNGRNFLVPTDARLSDAAALDDETIDTEMIYQRVADESGGRKAIVLLDTGRDPLPERAAVTGTDRFYKDLLIGYATATKNFETGSGHSAYASALLRRLDTPGVAVWQLLKDVQDDVMAATGGEQRPEVQSSFFADVYLVDL